MLFEVARTYQSYRASLILAYSVAWGALLVCTLLPGALDSYRELLVLQNGIYLGLSAVEHFSEFMYLFQDSY